MLKVCSLNSFALARYMYQLSWKEISTIKVLGELAHTGFLVCIGGGGAGDQKLPLYKGRVLVRRGKMALIETCDASHDLSSLQLDCNI